MTNSPNIIAGLDIGTTKICCVIAKQGIQGIEIIGMGQTPSPGVRHGQVLNIEGTSIAIRKAVDQAQRTAGSQMASVVVGIADRTIKSSNCTGVTALNGREVTELDIQRVLASAKSSITAPDYEFLHVIPREYRVDALEGVVNPLGMACSRLEVRAHLITAGTTSIRNITRACQRAELDVSSIVLQSLASADAVLTKDEMEMGVALLDIGGGTTDIAVFKHGMLWYTAELAKAGSHITADLTRHLRILPSVAEQLKLQFGTCTPVSGAKVSLGAKTFLQEEIVNIITARVEELIAEAATHIRRSRHGGRLLAGLVVTGGTSLLPDLDLFVEQMTTVPVRIGKPTDFQGLGDIISHPACSTGVGLVLCRYGVAPILSSKETNEDNGLLKKMYGWFREHF